MKSNVLKYLVKEPTEILEKNPAIILIHGYGSNEEDLFAFASELPSNYYIFSVQAPYQLPPYGFAWYAITFDANMNKFSDDDQAIASRDLLVTFMNDMVDKYPVDETNINLVGFSQGAILSYAVALTYPEKVNKIVALSGYFNPDIMEPKQDFKAYEALKIFASHGTVDQVIPVEWARRTAQELQKYQISFEYKEYPVGHGVAPQNFYDFKEFLLK